MRFRFNLRTLRKYQSQAVNACLSALNEGKDRQLISAATGSGKTVICSNISNSFRSTLFCTDTDELLEQSAMAFIRERFTPQNCNFIENKGLLNWIDSGGTIVGNPYSVGAIKASVFKPYGNVIFGSLQTLHRRLDKLHPQEYDAVIVDEAHVSMSPSAQKTLDFLKPKLLLGVSATCFRADGIPLSRTFGEKVFEYSIRDGIKDGYLVELDGIRIKTNVSLDNVKTKGGDLNESQLANEVNTLARNNLIAESYLKYAKGRKSIGFAVNIKHAIDLTEAFQSKGINASAISSNEELTGDREQTLKDFKEGRIDVLFNVGILTKGFDAPDVSCIIMGRPTKSLTLFIQMIGRGTRALTGILEGLESDVERILAIKKSTKKECIILDVVDITSKHDICNCHDLDKNLDPDERVYITQEKRDLLNDARKKTTIIETLTNENKKVKLLSLPELKYSKSYGKDIPATEEQLLRIEKLGYDTVSTYYSQAMINDIILNLSASTEQKNALRMAGYKIEGFVSKGIALTVLNKIRA